MTKERVKYMVQSIAIMAIATFLSFFLQSYGIRKENILMIYIVGVLVITVTTTGYLYGMMASVCSVLLFNYFFTVPVHTFAMTDQNDVVLLVFFSLSQDSFPQVLWYDFIIRCVLQRKQGHRWKEKS